MPWTIVAFPTPAWAEQVFGEPDVARLWDAIRTTVRLDEPDPVAAWAAHVAMLQERADQTERATVRRGSLPRAGDGPDASGCSCAVALDGRGDGDRLGPCLRARTCRPRRSSRLPTGGGPRGTVRATQPLVLIGGTVVTELEMTFSNGRITEGRRGDRCRRGPGRRSALDDGAALLGEVALVDETSARRPERRHLLEHALRRERRLPHRVRHGGHACASTSTAGPRPTRSLRRWASTTRRPTRTS